MTTPAEHISDLSAQRVITPVGRVRWDLSLVASTATASSLVSAAAYAESDGQEHFSVVAAPLFSTDAGTALSPTVTTLAGQPLLLLGLRQVQTGIAAALLP
jgi:hypothetical protein